MRRHTTLARLSALATLAVTALASAAAQASPAPAEGHGAAAGGHGGGAGTGHGGEGDIVGFLFNWPSESDHRIGFVYLLINFFLLLVLINRLVFRNLVGKNAARHDEIKQHLADATKAKADAETLLAEFADKLERIDSDREAIMGRARSLAEAERARIIEEARLEAEKIRTSAVAAAEREAEFRRREIERSIIDQAVVKAEAILVSQFGENDQRRIVDDYVSAVANTPLGGHGGAA